MKGVEASEDRQGPWGVEGGAQAQEEEERWDSSGSPGHRQDDITRLTEVTMQYTASYTNSCKPLNYIQQVSILKAWENTSVDTMLSDSLKDVPSEWHVKPYHCGAGEFQNPDDFVKYIARGVKKMEEPKDRRDLRYQSNKCNVRTLFGTRFKQTIEKYTCHL